MLIKGALFDELAARNAVHAEFAQRSIPHDRIELVGRLANPRDHLNLYSRVDIALDTYPYVGTTTICESLLMGVPIISRAGDQHVSRVGVSLLTHAGCTEFVTHSADLFVRFASELAHDATRRAQYHATLREKLLASSVCDGAKFAATFGSTIRAASHANMKA
jgi:predicted O-linked N-acetylglucosamine transferase (SPINDLY family)